MDKKTILVTGVMGYIGSHTAVKLLQKGYKVIGLDNESTGLRSNLDGIRQICGNDNFEVIIDDIRNPKCLEYVNENIDAVIHFAGLKSVRESQDMPLEYYENNVEGTINILSCMRSRGIEKIVFSSSATIYGDVAEDLRGGISEHDDATTTPSNVYGETKKTCENLMNSIANSDIHAPDPSFPGFSAICLRYFNPIGFHESGLLCENLKAAENIIPSIIRVINGQQEKFNVFGADYSTPDGTAVRDYIDIDDLVDAHILALENLIGDKQLIKYSAINIGSGSGYSVMEVLSAFEKAGYKIPYNVAPRRSGDAEQVYAKTKLARKMLGWQPKKTIDDSVLSVIQYLEKNKIINKNLI